MIWFAAGLAVGLVVTLIAVGMWLPPVPDRVLSRAELRSRAAHATALVDDPIDDGPSNVRILSAEQLEQLRIDRIRFEAQ